MWELMVRASQNYDDAAFVKAVDLMQKNNNVGLEIFYFPPMCEAKNTK